MDINMDERTYLPDCPLEMLAPDPRNCRAHLGTDEELEELAETIQSVGGLIEPIIARPRPEWVPADHYPGAKLLVVSGHRRRVGCEMAGMSTARVHVWPDLDDAQAIKIQLMENLHRKDISPIDEAIALRRLMDELGYSTVDCSIAIGKTTQHVRNRIRLLDLPETVQDCIATGTVSLSVANQLIQLPKPVQDRVIADNALKDTASMRSHVQYYCMRNLSDAPFDLALTYADIIPCTECHHRGSKVEMFGDESPDCPGAACYDRKCRAYRKQMDAQHKAQQGTQSRLVTVHADDEKRKLDNEIREAESDAAESLYLDAMLAFFSCSPTDILVGAAMSAISLDDITMSDKRHERAKAQGISPLVADENPMWVVPKYAWDAIRVQDVDLSCKLLGILCYTLPLREHALQEFSERFEISVDQKAIKTAKKAAKAMVEKKAAEAAQENIPKRRGKPFVGRTK